MRRAVALLALVALAGAASAVVPDQVWLELRVPPPYIGGPGTSSGTPFTIAYRHTAAATFGPTAIDLSAEPSWPGLEANVTPERVHAIVDPGGGEVLLNATLLLSWREGFARSEGLYITVTAVSHPNGNLPSAYDQERIETGMASGADPPGYSGGSTYRDGYTGSRGGVPGPDALMVLAALAVPALAARAWRR